MRRFVLMLVLAGALPSWSQVNGGAAVVYRLSFPEPEHHWMQVEATFAETGAGPLDVRMSRSSPGRYAVSEFAKNVFSVEAFDGKGQKLRYSRPDPDTWRVAGHDGTVRVVYKVFGDYPSGTYLGIDTTHAHLNMPASFMWAEGLENRASRVTFAIPPGSRWKVGTQLFPTPDPSTFTAPNLQYLMDSPTELADLVSSSFTETGPDGASASIRIAVHSDAPQADVDELAKMVRRLVREQAAIFGEFPRFEPGAYTFLLDYVPWSPGDGMEHRNSTFISGPGISLRTPQGRQAAMDAISHEFFHAWNVERIRPSGLEPFDFTRENVTCCLWLAEGFTEYYGPLLLTRAGFGGGPPLSDAIAVMNSPARLVRSPVEMSEYGPFADGAGTFVDAVDAGRTFLSYYTYGAGLALALDLSIRDVSGGKLSLDDYMKLLWREHGKPGGPSPGLVARPYSLADLRSHLASLTANRRFADEFFDRYIEGRESPDFARLLQLAGYRVVPAPAGQGWVGAVGVASVADGLAVGGRGAAGRSAPVPFGTPLYAAGIDSGDVVTSIDGQPATMALWNGLIARKPGERVALGILRRDGERATRTLTIAQDPTVRQIVPVESQPGGVLSAAQREFRREWLSTGIP